MLFDLFYADKERVIHVSTQLLDGWLSVNMAVQVLSPLVIVCWCNMLHTELQYDLLQMLQSDKHCEVPEAHARKIQTLLWTMRVDGPTWAPAPGRGVLLGRKRLDLSLVATIVLACLASTLKKFFGL